MASDTHSLIESFDGRRRTINFYRDLHCELNDHQEQRFITFAQDRWSLKSFIGYTQIQREAAAAQEN
jgi:DNA-directed RNA polymerase delta subunit